MNCILISVMFHLDITSFDTAYTSKEKTERHKKCGVESNTSDPEPFKHTRLVLVYFDKNCENKQKQLLIGTLTVELFCKLFLLIYILENF